MPRKTKAIESNLTAEEINTETNIIVEDFWTKYRREQKEKLEKAKLGIRKVIEDLRKIKVKKVEINFSGGGDDGSIEYVEFLPDTITESEELKDQIEEWAYIVLDLIGVDWCNNDGGFGFIKINVHQGTYSYEVNQYYTESSLEAQAQDIDLFEHKEEQLLAEE